MVVLKRKHKKKIEQKEAKKRGNITRTIVRNIGDVQKKLEKDLIEDELISTNSQEEEAYSDPIDLDEKIQQTHQINQNNDKETNEVDELLKNLTEEEERAFNMFINPNVNFIQKNTQFANFQNYLNMNECEDEQEVGPILDPLIESTYRDVGKVMAHYRSGPVPKAFKVLPIVREWTRVLPLMNPEKWTAAALTQCIKYFVSSGKSTACAELFMNLLLPRFRDDVLEYKKLNFHLQLALDYATKKSAAFFKGFLLPLAESGDCTLREAIIVAGLVKKSRFSPIHAAVALFRLSNMAYSSANSLFIRAIVQKNYALPYKVLDRLVEHFAGFISETRELTIVWHHCLLSFVTGYGEFLALEQLEILTDLIKEKRHHLISAEIKKMLEISWGKVEQKMELATADD